MTVLAPSVRRVSPFTRVQTRAASVTAAVIAELLLKADRHERTRATDWRAVVRAAIEQLATECAIPNWDGYGASGISTLAKETAQRFVDLLPTDIPEPQVVPEPDGHIALCWDFGRDRVFTISIGESETATYAGILGRDVKRHGQEPFREDVAKILVDSVREISPGG
jgi:hypothetical protein